MGFGVVEASEGPLAADEVVDVEALFGVGGVVVEVAVLNELLEVGGVLAGEEEGFGVDAGFVGPSNLATHNLLKLKQ